MKSINKVILLGYVGKDPELRSTNAGQSVVGFSLATSEGWMDKDSGELKKRTEWHNIIAWNKLAEIASQYIRKGSKVYVEGRIQSREYNDKETGAKRRSFEVIANELILLDSKEVSEEKSSSSLAAAPQTKPQTLYDDDIPF